jgi:hypothetical protein
LGFQAEQTQLTADGGIDIWAVNNSPILGGRVIVQCKRYGTDASVGEPTVRELYGLVHAHGVTKGVVITTSKFTAGAMRFAEGKPLELIDGVRLMALVRDIGVDSIRLPDKNGESRRQFCSFDLVVRELEEWLRSYSQPYPLRFSISSGAFLEEEVEAQVNCSIGACQDIDGQMLNMEVGSNFKLAVEIAHAIDYLKAEYLIVQGAQFRPASAEAQPQPEASKESQDSFWHVQTTSTSEEILAGLRHLCGVFEQIAKSEKVRLVIDEYVYSNPRADCAMDRVQQNIAKFCLKYWWKPQRR